MPLTGKTALVTGGAQGLGLAIAERLARDGAAVAIADLQKEAAESAASSIIATGGKACALAMNVADEQAVTAGMNDLVENFGAPTILINNAGIMPGAPALELDLSAWQAALDVNLSGCLIAARAVLPLMQDVQWGRIVNLGSLMSNVAFGGDAAYCTTKAGVLGLTRSLAAEFGPSNICVNAICPGNIMTEMLEKVAVNVEEREGLEPGSFIKDRANDIPLRRLGEPEDIAKVVAFLCGPDADYVTGQAIHVNGGLYYH